MCILKDKTYKFYFSVTALIGGYILSNQSFADNVTTATERNIIGREAEIRRQLEEEFRKKRPPQQTSKSLPLKKTEKQNSAIFIFNKIIFKNSTLIPKLTKSKLTKPYIFTKVNVGDIQNLLKDITNYYIKKGYVTTRAYLEPQDLKTKILTVTIFEGKIESVTVKEREDGTTKDNNRTRTGFCNATPNMYKQHLNIRDLEQGIDQIGRLKSHNPHINILPGSKPCFSKVEINDNITKPWHTTFAVDNNGSESTGREQGEFKFEFDDALNLHDAWSIYYRQNINRKHNKRQSRNIMGQGSIPFGYWTLRFSASKFDYYTTQGLRQNQNRISGISKYYNTEIERIISRNSVGKTGVGLCLSVKNQKPGSESVITIQKHQLTVGGLKLFHVQRMGGGVFSSSFQYSKGLEILGATKNKSVRQEKYKAQFEKYTLDLAFSKPFTINENNFMYSFMTHMQYSPYDLFSSEQISVGGMNSVRGFLNNVCENTGAYFRNEVIYYFKNFSNTRVRELFGNLETFLGLDFGDVKTDISNTYGKGILSGVACGFRLKNGLFFGETSISKYISKKPRLIPHKSIFSLRIGITF